MASLAERARAWVEEVHPHARHLTRTLDWVDGVAGAWLLTGVTLVVLLTGPWWRHQLGRRPWAGWGMLAGALALTTEYIRTRKQFGRALAEFQAVTVQIADVYIAGRALDVAVWSGAWLLAEGSAEDAETDLTVGALSVTDSALRALYTCQHLHGGIGVDVTYPLHRYFAWGKHHAHLLGGVEARLDTIGARV